MGRIDRIYSIAWALWIKMAKSAKIHIKVIRQHFLKNHEATGGEGNWGLCLDPYCSRLPI